MSDEQNGAGKASESSTSALLCCPFCGSDDISSGEVMGKHLDGKYFSQTACVDCGASGPETVCADATDIRLEIECDIAWNKRAT